MSRLKQLMIQRHETLIPIIFTLTILKAITEETRCSEALSNNALMNDCADLGLQKIPTNLNPNIETMIISYNNLIQIKKDDMKRYKNLKKFVYSKETQSHTTKFDPDAFADLIKLEHIVLSYNNLKGTKISFPKHSKDLSLIHTGLDDASLNLSNLDELETATLNENNLTEFPLLHKFAPSNLLDLHTNPLQTFSAKKIARYCKLKNFGLSVDVIPEFLDNNCECPRLKRWIILNKIDGILPTDFHCKSTEPCPEPLITDRMKLLYDNCMKNIKNPILEDEENNPLIWKAILFWIFVIGIVIATTVFAVYMVYNAIDKAKKNRIEYEYKNHSTTSTSEPEVNSEEKE